MDAEEEEEKMEVEEVEIEKGEEKLMDVGEEEVKSMDVEETLEKNCTDMNSMKELDNQADHVQKAQAEDSEEDPFSPLSSSQMRQLLAGMVQTPNREPGRPPVKRKLEFGSPYSTEKKLVLNNFSDIKPIIIAPEGCAENPILIVNSDEGTADNPIVVESELEGSEDNPIIVECGVEGSEDNPIFVQCGVEGSEDNPIIVECGVEGSEDNPIILDN